MSPARLVGWSLAAILGSVAVGAVVCAAALVIGLAEAMLR